MATSSPCKNCEKCNCCKNDCLKTCPKKQELEDYTKSLNPLFYYQGIDTTDESRYGVNYLG